MNSSKLIESAIQLLGDGQNSWSESYVAQNKNRFIKDLDQIRALISEPNKRVADLGAAPFVTSLAIKNLGHQVDCYDVAPNRFQFKQLHGLDLFQLDLDDWTEVKSNTYDLIILGEVFEHLRGNLIQVAENIFDSLKPGGKLYLTTPNFRSITGIYKLLFKKVSYAYSKDLYLEWNKLREVGHMGHVREYTHHELIHFFKKNGFQAEKTFTRPLLLGPGWKNKLLYASEIGFNLLKLGGSSTFVFSKPLK